MTTALVTGANGHVGAHLCRELLARGYSVVALVRPTSDLSGLQGLAVEIRRGDVTDRDAFVRAAQGCDLIFHTAAVYQTWVADPEQVMRPAVEGTANAFAAARAAGIKRIVLTSSIVAIGMSEAPDRLRTEADWNEDPHNVYYRAKTESERRAHALAKETGIELVVVCPGGVIGSLDYRITPSTKIVQGWLDGSGSTWRGATNFVAASDVARVHALAAEKGRPGGRYLAVGENMHSRQMGEVLERVAGIRPKHLGFPLWLALVVAFFLELAARLTKRPPLLSRALARDVIDRYGVYDPSQTHRELGHSPRALDDALRETAAWLVHLRALPPGVAAKVAERCPPDAAWPAPQGRPPAQAG